MPSRIRYKGRRKKLVPGVGVLIINCHRPYRGGTHQGDHDDHGFHFAPPVATALRPVGARMNIALSY